MDGKMNVYSIVLILLCLYRYHRNLRTLHIVHPSFRTKFMTWWFTTFTATEVKDKVNFVTGVEYLYDSVNPEQLDIPQFILDWDSKVSKTYFILSEDDVKFQECSLIHRVRRHFTSVEMDCGK